MNNFPLEIIELIVGHINAHGDLYTCLFINKLFYKATLPVLWHSPKRALSKGRTVPIQYRHVYRCNALTDSLGFFGVSNRHHIRRLSFSGIANALEITKLLPLVPLLTELALSQMIVGDEVMDMVARRCHRLQRISLHFLYRITHQTTVSLAQYCPQLTSISLSGCYNISPADLLPLLEANDVEQLTIGVALPEIRDVHYNDEVADVLSLLGQYYPRMLQKNPYSISFMRDWARLTRSSNSEWALRLTELCLCYVANETLLMPFLETHTRLKSLTLASCHLKFGTLAAIAIFLPDLRRLDLSCSQGFSSRSLKNMVKLGCPQLRLLVLTGCQRASKEFALTGPVDRLHRDDLERLRWEPEIPARLRPSKIPTLISPRRRQIRPALIPSLDSLLHKFTTYTFMSYDADEFLPPEIARGLFPVPAQSNRPRRNAMVPLAPTHGGAFHAVR